MQLERRLQCEEVGLWVAGAGGLAVAASIACSGSDSTTVSGDDTRAAAASSGTVAGC